MDNKDVDLLKEVIEANNRATRATIESEINRIDEKADRIIAHQEKQNGTLDRHEQMLNNSDLVANNLWEYQKNCVANKNWAWVKRRWYVLLLGLGVFYFSLEWLYHGVDVKMLVRGIIEKFLT